jgi:hypothetical protein
VNLNFCSDNTGGPNNNEEEQHSSWHTTHKTSMDGKPKEAGSIISSSYTVAISMDEEEDDTSVQPRHVATLENDCDGDDDDEVDNCNKWNLV